MHLFFWHKQNMINRPLKVLLVVSGLFMFADAMLMPIYALFVEEVGGNVTTASNTYAVFWLVAGSLTFLAGKLENKMKETELVIAWSQFIVSLGYLIYYFTKTTTTLYLIMVILGVANAFFWPAFHSIYTKHVDGHKSAWQWSFYDGLAYLIPALGAAAGGWLVKLYGFGLIFLVMAALTFLCGIFVLILPRKVL